MSQSRLAVLLGRLAASHSRFAESQRKGAVSLKEVQVLHGLSGAAHNRGPEPSHRFGASLGG